jgi:L-asparaginase
MRGGCPCRLPRAVMGELGQNGHWDFKSVADRSTSHSFVAVQKCEGARVPEYKNMRIRILVTGGTFDKQYDELTGRLYFRETHVPAMLGRGRCRLDVTVETVMMVDSLDLDERGRSAIVDRCRASEEKALVVTHGTDTMVETARAIAAAGLGDRTIVLTGAMIPYAFGSSDGLFNLGSALSLAQVVPPGVYIAMNGQYFAWDRVRKNRESGIFEATA